MLQNSLEPLSYESKSDKHLKKFHQLCVENSIDVIGEKTIDFNPDSLEGLIKVGRFLVKSNQCYQALLSYYALKACTVRHGGYSDGIYTLKKYAEDVGVAPKTLQNWTMIYRRVVVHLGVDLKDFTSEDWKKATKVAYNEESRIRQDNRSIGRVQKEAYKEQKVTRSPEEIKKAFYMEKEESLETHINNWNYELNTIKRKLLKVDIHKCPEKVLIEIMESCDQISDHINNTLTDLKRRKH